MNDTKLNWFPGHMAKTLKEFEKELKLIDLIIEIVDSRSINLTSDSEIVSTIKNKNIPILKIASKSDLSDIDKSLYNHILVGSIKDNKFRNLILNEINNKLSQKIEKLKSKGYANPKVYIAIVGLPNVGKSSFINFLLNKKNLTAKNEPGVTRKKEWVKLSNYIYLLDTPGVSFKKINNEEDFYKLTLLRTINWNIVDKYKTIEFAYNFYLNKYSNELKKYYKFNDNFTFDNFLEFYANKFKLMLKNNEYDIETSLEKLYIDFSNNLICRVNYEK